MICYIFEKYMFNFCVLDVHLYMKNTYTTLSWSLVGVIHLLSPIKFFDLSSRSNLKVSSKKKKERPGLNTKVIGLKIKGKLIVLKVNP